MGCPCPKSPINPDYTCIKMSEFLNCSDEKIECDTNGLGQCECKNKGLCIWSKDRPIAGCPCSGKF